MPSAPMNPVWKELILAALAEKPRRLQDIVGALNLPYSHPTGSYSPEATAVSRLLGVMRRDGLIYNEGGMWYPSAFTMVDISAWPLSRDPVTYPNARAVMAFVVAHKAGTYGGEFAIYASGKLVATTREDSSVIEQALAPKPHQKP